jgi:hypothetical protein
VPGRFDPFNLFTDLIMIVLPMIMCLLLLLARRGRVALTGMILVVSLWLGLSVAKMLVGSMDGEIQMGKGSTVIVRFHG